MTNSIWGAVCIFLILTSTLLGIRIGKDISPDSQKVKIKEIIFSLEACYANSGINFIASFKTGKYVECMNGAIFVIPSEYGAEEKTKNVKT